MFYEFITAPPLRLQNYIVIVLKIGQDLPFLDLKLTFYFSSFYFGPVHVHLSKSLILKFILIMHNFYPEKKIQAKLILILNCLRSLIQNIFLTNFTSFTSWLVLLTRSNEETTYESKISCYFWPKKTSFQNTFWFKIFG